MALRQDPPKPEKLAPLMVIKPYESYRMAAGGDEFLVCLTQGVKVC
jgi:hypothetical protein